MEWYYVYVIHHSRLTSYITHWMCPQVLQLHGKCLRFVTETCRSIRNTCCAVRGKLALIIVVIIITAIIILVLILR